MLKICLGTKHRRYEMIYSEKGIKIYICMYVRTYNTYKTVKLMDIKQYERKAPGTNISS